MGGSGRPLRLLTIRAELYNACATSQTRHDFLYLFVQTIGKQRLGYFMDYDFFYKKYLARTSRAHCYGAREALGISCYDH